MITKGQKISERYQVIKSIGEGGMANVYLAYDTILDRNVAVKVLRGDLATDEKFVRRFQREALAASSLSNPNIVEVYDVGEDNGEYYIVMEYVEGKHLKQLLRKRGKLTVSEVVDIALQITSGLCVAHDAYIIHRDIKPQNILILDNGLIKITDFGIAVALNSTQLTQTNSVMGSVHYLPPEQASGKQSTLQSDIYSLGIMLYELLSGKLPFRGDNAVEIALKHLKEPMPYISDEVPNVPQSLENIIIRATAKNPKNRYNDAREMYEDLKTCLEETRKNESRISLKYPENETEGKNSVKDSVLKPVGAKPSKEPVKEIKEVEKEDDITMKTKNQKKEVKKQNKLLIFLLSILTIIVIVITTVLVLIPKINESNQVKVPDVAGLSITEAIDKIQEAGFTVSDEQVEQPSGKIEEGLIIKTSPAGGSKRKSGTTITLYVSTGENKILVEDYKGKNYIEIKAKLETLGLQVFSTHPTDEDVENDKNTYEENEIIVQDVEPGTYLEEGSTITFTIPDITVKFPDFTDGSYSKEEIEAWCKEYDVELVVVEEENDEYTSGTIFYQSLPEGYTVLAGAKLRIKVVATTAAPEEETDDF